MNRPFAAHPEAFTAYYMPMSEASVGPARVRRRAWSLLARIRLGLAGGRA